MSWSPVMVTPLVRTRHVGPRTGGGVGCLAGPRDPVSSYYSARELDVATGFLPSSLESQGSESLNGNWEFLTRTLTTS